MHGNAIIHLPRESDSIEHVMVIQTQTEEVVWKSFPLPVGVDSVRLDVWNGRFINMWSEIFAGFNRQSKAVGCIAPGHADPFGKSSRSGPLLKSEEARHIR